MSDRLARDSLPIRTALAALLLAVPLAVLVVVKRPRFDGAVWENHAAHFWLVLAAAAIGIALGYAVRRQGGAGTRGCSSFRSHSP